MCVQYNYSHFGYKFLFCDYLSTQSPYTDIEYHILALLVKVENLKLGY